MGKWILRTVTDDQLRNLVAEVTSFRQLGIRLGMLGGSTQGSLKKRVFDLQIDTTHFTGSTWNKGLTSKTNASVARIAQKVSLTRRGKPGKKHSVETRQKMSAAAQGKSFANNARVKRYDVLNPALNSTVTVQGTWELKYALWLNQQEITWIRPSNSFKWTSEDDVITHAYHPDFYLPESNTYVEIKGFMWKDPNRKIDDARKLRLVQEQNPSLVLRVLMKSDLKNLGVL